MVKKVSLAFKYWIPRSFVVSATMPDKGLNFVANVLHAVELVKSTVEHREPIIVNFFILHAPYATLRKLELLYKFFDKLCEVNKFEELERVTYSFYLVLAEEDLYDFILPRKRAE